MTQKKLPNGTTVLVLGILSMIFCWCYGIVGLVLSIIALVLYHKDIKVYQENPDLYKDFPNLNIGRTLAIIGLCLSTLYLIFLTYLLSLGEQGMKDFLHNLEMKVEQQREMNE